MHYSSAVLTHYLRKKQAVRCQRRSYDLDKFPDAQFGVFLHHNAALLRDARSHYDEAKYYLTTLL